MATRFRLTADGANPAVSPAFQSYSHAMVNRRKLLTSDSSALTTSAVTPDAADHLVAGDAGHLQFVSEPMAAGITFTSGNTIKYCVQCLEANAGNNLQVQLFVSVVSSDGGTVRRTLRTKVLEGLELATSLTSRFHSTTQDGADYTTVAGDRLVVEFSVSGTPTGAGGVQGHNASLRWGGSGAGGDLLENDTQTGTTLNPWIEFAPTIGFLHTASAAVGAGPATASGTAAHTPPTYSGSAAVTVGHATASGSATHTPPTYTAAAAVSAAPATASGSATFTGGAEAFTASAAVTTGAATVSGSATFTAPVYTGSAAVSAKGATASGSAAFTAPVYTATAALTAGRATTSGSAAFTPPVYAATAALTARAATATGSALFASAIYSASAALTASAVTCSGVATVADPPPAEEVAATEPRYGRSMTRRPLRTVEQGPPSPVSATGGATIPAVEGSGRGTVRFRAAGGAAASFGFGGTARQRFRARAAFLTAPPLTAAGSVRVNNHVARIKELEAELREAEDLMVLGI